MDPITILAAASAGVKLAQSLMPEIDRLLRSGQLTVEQQAQAREVYDSLKAEDAGQFTGPHWEIDPHP